MQDDFRTSTVRGELFRHPGTCYQVIQTRQMVQPSQPRAQSLCDRLVREMTTSLRLLVDCRRIVENLSHNPSTPPWIFGISDIPSSEDGIHPSVCSFRCPDTQLLQF